MSRKNNLRRLLSPKSIVMIGGSNLTRPIDNALKIGFTGKIWVVNPIHNQIGGITCYKRVADLPEIPDAAFIAVNAKATVDVVTELKNKGCGGIVCYAAGFAETGNDGEQLQQRLIDAAADMALVGPNCYGLLNFSQGIALWPDRLLGKQTEKGVAIISQSGNISLTLTMQDRSLPISHMISVGNQAVLESSDYIDILLDDDHVLAIGLYLEGFKDIESFSRVALKALKKGVPIVALKAGTSDIGTQLIKSHTSTLAGSNDLYCAMFKRFGVLHVHSLGEMLETLKIAVLRRVPSGERKRIAVLTCSGGDSAMAADKLQDFGLSLPPITQSQKEQLSTWLPSFASYSNPLDYNTSIWGNQNACTEVFNIMMSGNCDLVALILDFPHSDDQEWQTTVNALIDAHKNSDKTTVVISSLSELLPLPVRNRLMQAGIAPLQGLSEGVAAIDQWIRYAQRRKDIIAMNDVDELILRKAVPCCGERQMLDEWESKQLIAQYGLPIAKGQIASLPEMSQVSSEIGFPVVLKGISRQLVHKTETNAVVLNLKDPTELHHAATAMFYQLQTKGLKDFKFLIEPMVSDAVCEMIIGLKRDDQFGLALILGTGGIMVNLLNDSVTLLLPTTQYRVAAALTELKGAKLLNGYRGRPAGDTTAVIDAVMSVANFAMDHWNTVVELDINPLMVRPKGKGVIAVDALVCLQG